MCKNMKGIETTINFKNTSFALTKHYSKQSIKVT